MNKINVRFVDDDNTSRTFAGYTDGRRWNGFECPHLPLTEFVRVLAVLVEWGEERGYEVIDDHSVRVHGLAHVDDIERSDIDRRDFVMTAKLCTTREGDRWLFDCGGAWTFVEAPRR